MSEPLRQEPPVDPPVVSAPLPPASEERSPWWTLVVTVMCWLFGVLLPAVTLLIELDSRMCTEEFFDPLPTAVHAVLVGLVPLANALGLIAARHGLTRLFPAAVLLNGLTIAVSLLYAVVFLPLLPTAVIAILILGLGLLPLAPLMSLITALTVRKRLRRAHPADVPISGPWWGMALGVGVLLIATAPTLVTRVGLNVAVNGSPEAQRRALHWLRRVGSEELLRASSYAAGRRSIFGFTETVTTEQARAVYYKVTGQPFNTLPKPEHLMQGGWTRWGDDEDQASESVGGRVPGLSLASSELKGSVDGDAALAYLEWTMSFATTAEGQSEARTEVVLPPGAAVSRVTLFIDGQEREAAFASTGQVKAAYEKIVQARRDPLLVTQRGKDRVQVQCFPVVKGPPMKIKLGITVPLVPRDEGHSAALLLPTLAERNFHIDESVRHVVRVESRRPLRAPAGGNLEQRPDGVSEWLTALSGELSTPPVLTVDRKGAPSVAWTEDLVDSASTHVIRQELRSSVAQAPTRVVLVVDASRGMEAALPEIAGALVHFPHGTELALLASLDGVEELLPPQKADAQVLQRAAKEVARLNLVGGQDASPALARAWSLVAPEGRTVVVWVHGPHPLPPSEVPEGSPWWLSAAPPAEVLDVMVGQGANRIAVDLARDVPLRAVPRVGGLGQDLRDLFATWGSAVPEFHRQRLPVSELTLPPEAWKTSSHLARLWAREAVAQLVASRDEAAVQRAAAWAERHQLVTEVTGAVVLERQEQYDEAGLRPVEPGTVPTVPEPETWMLLAVACALLLVAFRLRRAA